MVNLKKKEPVVLALSPRVAVGDDSLPRVIGGRCEFTGKVFNDRDECPWFNGLCYDDKGEKLPDSWTGDLNANRAAMLKSRAAIMFVEKPKRVRKPKAEAPVEVAEEVAEEVVEQVVEEAPAE